MAWTQAPAKNKWLGASAGIPGCYRLIRAYPMGMTARWAVGARYTRLNDNSAVTHRSAGAGGENRGWHDCKTEPQDSHAR